MLQGARRPPRPLFSRTSKHGTTGIAMPQSVSDLSNRPRPPASKATLIELVCVGDRLKSPVLELQQVQLRQCRAWTYWNTLPEGSCKTARALRAMFHLEI